MSVILGIDPGSRITGYGVIDSDGQRHRYVASGVVRVQGNTLAEKLLCIFRSIQELTQLYNPVEGAIEQVFVSRNANSALKLGQARGSAILAMAMHGLLVGEYAPRTIKQAVVGYGGADKTQVQHMVQLLLNLNGTPSADAADALAIALCHAQTRQMRAMLERLEAST